MSRGPRNHPTPSTPPFSWRPFPPFPTGPALRQVLAIQVGIFPFSPFLSLAFSSFTLCLRFTQDREGGEAAPLSFSSLSACRRNRLFTDLNARLVDVFLSETLAVLASDPEKEIKLPTLLSLLGALFPLASCRRRWRRPPLFFFLSPRFLLLPRAIARA